MGNRVAPGQCVPKSDFGNEEHGDEWQSVDILTG
jgi:hypothetical protein